MALKSELQKQSIRGQVVESAAATYTQATIDTNLAITARHVFILERVWFQYEPLNIVSESGDQWQAQLTYASQTAMVSQNDPDLLANFIQGIHVVVEGGFTIKRVFQIELGGIPIASPQLFLAIKGTATAAALTLSMRALGYLQRVTEAEFFRVAAAR